MSLRKLIKLAIELERSSIQYHSPKAVALREEQRKNEAKDLVHPSGPRKVSTVTLNQILGR